MDFVSLCHRQVKAVRMSIHSFRPNSHPEKFLSFHTKTIENYEINGEIKNLNMHVANISQSFTTYWGVYLVFAMGFPIERQTRGINEGRHIKLCLDRYLKFKSKHTTSTRTFEPGIKVTKLSIVRTTQQMKI